MPPHGVTRQIIIDGIIAGKSRQTLARELGLTLAGVDYHMGRIVKNKEIDPTRLAAWRTRQQRHDKAETEAEADAEAARSAPQPSGGSTSGITWFVPRRDDGQAARQPAGQPSAAPDPKALPCADCIHQPVCRLADDRRRAYEALSAAARAVPAGLVAEYRVRCEHAEAATEPRKTPTRGVA